MIPTPLKVPEDPNSGSGPRFALVFSIVAIVLNLFPLVAAWQDKSWGALQTAFIGVPVLNGAIAILDLIPIPFERRDSNYSVWFYVAISIGVPFSVAAATVFAIFS